MLEDSIIPKKAKAKPVIATKAVIATKPAAPSKRAATGPQPIKLQK